MNNLSAWEIAICLDFQEDENISAEIDESIACFPINRIYRSRSKKGILDNLTDGLSYEFSSGAEEVIFLEDDFILRSDALQYLDSIGREEFMISISGNSDTVVCHYRPRGNLITSRNFSELCQWIKCREYIGIEKTGQPGYFFDMKHTNHDAIFACFIEKKHKMVRFPSEFYVAHFGITGVHLNTEEAQMAEAKIFSGDRTKWLTNVLSAFKNMKFTPEIQKRLWPKEFEYK